MGSKRAPDRIMDAEIVGRPLGSLWDRSWKPLGASGSALGALFDALAALLEPKTLQLEPQSPPDKPDIVVGPESTDVMICLRPCNHLPTSWNHLPTSVESSAYVL